MLKNLSATKKGMITGLLMIGFSLLFYYCKFPFDSPLEYMIYVVYAAGVVWAVLEFARSADHTAKFGAYFSQGFKCFIVVTLLMVLFTFIFNTLHPEFEAQMAANYREEVIKTGNKTPAEINSEIEKIKDYYIVVLLSGAIFSYLIIGAVVSAFASYLLKRRKS